MKHAAKIMGSAAMRLIEDPAALARVKREHTQRVAEAPYDQPLPPDLIAPPLRASR